MPNLAAIKAKANARYACQECGSTELIQAHHEIPSDDDSLVSLCAECHSRKHPDVPRALFFSAKLQPYWHNISASSLAKRWGVHPRTVIRVAKRLKIQLGELHPWDEELIRNNIPKLQRTHSDKCPNIPNIPTAIEILKVREFLVRHLIRIQERLGLNNAQFATTLNIHDKSWVRIKKHGTISADTLLTAIRVYPELLDTLANINGKRETIEEK